MKIKFAFASVTALMGFVAAAQAEPAVQQMVYHVDAAGVCSQAAAGVGDLQEGLGHCDTALRDPAQTHRAALLMDRGLIKARAGDTSGALGDYDAAIAQQPDLGDAYINRAAVNVSLKHYGDAMSDVTKGMQLNASNMAAAFFTRAVIADDRGDYQAAYSDYKQALDLKPDYAAARRELARFKKARRTAAN